MPKPLPQLVLSPADCHREVASILARGVVRWRKQVKLGHFATDSEAEKPPKTGLATCFETPLSGSLNTRGLRLREDGDDA